VEVRRGAGGEAGRLEADDPQLHGEVRLPDLRQHGVIYRKHETNARVGRLRMMPKLSERSCQQMVGTGYFLPGSIPIFRQFFPSWFDKDIDSFLNFQVR
jgi:hypothetical protein